MSSNAPGRPIGDNNAREDEMSKIVVSQFVTVDGAFEDPGGSEGFERGGWPSSSSAAPRATSSSSTR
jgi:hypothetical protein